MKQFKDRIASGDRLVFDGGMGISLFGKGLGLTDFPEACNLEHPDWIREISVGFREAGADVLQTNTFNASPIRLSVFGLEPSMEEINRRAVSIAREAAGAEGYVAASIGPSGLSPGLADAYESYCRQIEVLRDAGVDALTIETMSSLEDAVTALRAARETAPELPALVTLVFVESTEGIGTLRNQEASQVARALEAEGASAIGSNCGTGIDSMIHIARELRKATTLPLLIQPSAGIPQEKNGTLIFPESPEYFEPRVRELLVLGVNLIGGCCGTTPDHIRVMRRLVDG